MPVYRTVSDKNGDVKLEALWHPFVVQTDFSFDKRDDTLVNPIVSFIYPQRYSVDSVSVKWRGYEMSNPEQIGLRILLGIKGEDSRCYLDVPIGSLPLDPFGFYFFHPKHRYWIPSEGFAVMELYSLSEAKQSGHVIVKLDGEYFRSIDKYEPKIGPEAR